MVISVNAKIWRLLGGYCHAHDAESFGPGRSGQPYDQGWHPAFSHGKALAELKPEAAYFTVQNGLRTGLIFIDVQDISAMPAICEPFFMAFDAAIEMTPVMTADDLRTGLQAALQKM